MLTDEQFACWLAGFFDGEGCVYLPKRVGVEVSIASTEPSVIEMIHGRLGIGTVTRVTFDRPEWKPKYQWRVRNLPDAGTVLRLLRPFLTIKADKADLALQRCAVWDATRRARADRNSEITRLAASGVQHREISKRFGLDAKGRTVSYIVRGIIRDGSHPRKAVDPTKHRRAHEAHGRKSRGLLVRTQSRAVLP